MPAGHAGVQKKLLNSSAVSSFRGAAAVDMINIDSLFRHTFWRELPTVKPIDLTEHTVDQNEPADILCFQSSVIFPSWTPAVRQNGGQS
jgi:hypothetical protein